MRPPYSRRRPGTVRVLWEEGYIPILWSVTLWDWNKGVTTEKIMHKAEKQIRGGDVVLLTTAATSRWAGIKPLGHSADLILQQWKEQEGYEFVTIPEMIERSGFTVP